MFKSDKQKAQVYYISNDSESVTFEIIPELKKHFSFDLHIVKPKDKNSIIGKKAHILLFNDLDFNELDFSIIDQIKEENTTFLHTIFYGSKLSTEEQIYCYDRGVDYIIYENIPINLLVSRIKNIFKRKSNKYEKQAHYEFKGLTLDTDTRKVFDNGEQIHLSPTEFNVLFSLINNHPNPLSKSDLFQRVWGYTTDYSRTLDQYIFRVRNKLNKTKIITVDKTHYLLD